MADAIDRKQLSRRWCQTHLGLLREQEAAVKAVYQHTPEPRPPYLLITLRATEFAILGVQREMQRLGWDLKRSKWND